MTQYDFAIGCAELRFAPVSRRGLIENDDAVKVLRTIGERGRCPFLLILFKKNCTYQTANQSIALQNQKICGTFCGTLQGKFF
ncbi:MAG: hypothetical protein LBF67_06870, partial [Prevotellaceae bacterium]|nr:hypothetical protein [Prevotellaceae bacterium]